MICGFCIRIASVVKSSAVPVALSLYRGFFWVHLYVVHTRDVLTLRGTVSRSTCVVQEVTETPVETGTVSQARSLAVL